MKPFKQHKEYKMNNDIGNVFQWNWKRQKKDSQFQKNQPLFPSIQHESFSFLNRSKRRRKSQAYQGLFPLFSTKEKQRKRNLSARMPFRKRTRFRVVMLNRWDLNTIGRSRIGCSRFFSSFSITKKQQKEIVKKWSQRYQEEVDPEMVEGMTKNEVKKMVKEWAEQDIKELLKEREEKAKEEERIEKVEEEMVEKFAHPLRKEVYRRVFKWVENRRKKNGKDRRRNARRDEI